MCLCVCVVAPSVTATNQLVGARMGDNVTLECHCESFPRPVVYWLRHGSGDVVVSGTFLLHHRNYQLNYQSPLVCH